MEPSTARRVWELLEPYHAVVYFAPQTVERYTGAGLKGGWMGYFASRAAAMGPVPAEVVIASFYNFHPARVRRAIPDAWGFASPEDVLAARYEVADGALTKILGDSAGGEDLEEMAALARTLAESCEPVGRPLFAAHASLPWPSAPHMVLWHAATLYREFRGDGHVTTLLQEEVDGCEANVLMAAANMFVAETQRSFRGWSEEEWEEAEKRLQGRGILDESGALTPEGLDLRARIEDRTDVLAMPPLRAIGANACARLIGGMQPIVGLIKSGGGVSYPNPVGVPEPMAE
jgi:hypothetical protein